MSVSSKGNQAGQRKSTTAEGTAKSEKEGLWHREAVESIVVAIILALLFRTFEAEAFVIPTGSMAPTLQGRHKDIQCPECKYQFQAGASLDAEISSGPVVQVSCPMCFYPLRPNRAKRNHGAFSGDRILVNKFAYQFWEPDRWDVIVFKFPGNAKQNYIKRLVGLPNERLRIQHGDVLLADLGTDEFVIARKPPRKMRAMLQLVHDTRYIPQTFIKTNWPSSWVDPQDAEQGWQSSDDRQVYSLPPQSQPRWLRYRHLVPTRDDWQYLVRERPSPNAGRKQGELISDFYAYNHFKHRSDQPDMLGGWHWVGDLALEGELKISDAEGTVYLDLVKSGEHFRCEIDVATGAARLRIDGESTFDAAAGQAVTELTAMTKMQGAGKYRFLFSNVDQQLRLWIGNALIEWSGDGQPHDATYTTRVANRPVWTPDDPGDLMPLGIGGVNVQMSASKLRVWRDIYYVSAASNGQPSDYALNRPLSFDEVRRVFADPRRWSDTPLFDARREITFDLAENQFFPLGDNSPQSRDARLWGGLADSLIYDTPILVEPYVESEMLIGKAFLVYWPHGWHVGNIPLPIVPNISRMQRIR